MNQSNVLQTVCIPIVGLFLMLPTATISLLTMNVATSAAGAGMDSIIQSYPGTARPFGTGQQV